MQVRELYSDEMSNDSNVTAYEELLDNEELWSSPFSLEDVEDF